jgi:ferric hydroxamate transport system permease protein
VTTPLAEPPARTGGTPLLPPVAGRRPLVTGPVAVGVGLAVVAVLAAVHVTQGTSDVGVADVVRALAGGDDDHAWNVLVGARWPRLASGIVVGLALGASGAAMQSVARNNLASPELLGVTGGAFLAVSAAAAFSLSLPVWMAGGFAFAGGLAAAALVLALAAGGVAGPTRLVLAGSATALALHSGTYLLLILFQESTRGLFAWGSGSLVAVDTGAARAMLPVLAVGIGGLVLLGRRLDILASGDDTARSLGVDVARTRLGTVVLAVLLAAAAVAVAGPIGFVGLSAPAIVRFAATRSPNLLRHRLLVVLSALAGVIVVLGSDIAVRAVLGAGRAVEIPAGVATTMVGAVALIVLARRHRDAGPRREAPGAATAAARSPRRFAVVLGVAGVAVAGVVVAGLLLGGTTLLTGDVWLWLQGEAGRRTTFLLDERAPRVGAAVLAGAALALAGTAVQAVGRNPLAEPSVLGLTAGAGVGAVTATIVVPGAGVWAMAGAAAVGAGCTFAVVFRLGWRDGLHPDRLLLIGIGTTVLLQAVMVVLLLTTDPWNTPRALTWLSGSTYGRQLDHLVPVAVALVAGLPLLVSGHRPLDLLAVDDDVPRVLGVRLERTRALALGAVVALTAAAVTAIGVVAFVGLVAPHAARALVGGQHRRVLLVAPLLGAALVGTADAVGRTVIAPAQVPAGLITALIGTPYFAWLLWRSRSF